MEQELDKLLAADIIERVEGPTAWMSRIVTPPKPNNPYEIRICVDMRDANKAILRTRHVTPTVDDLMADLEGARVFSKIDLRSGYHQLLLDPECRHITTFSTHAGIFRYKRLNFGVNSAAEVFQHTIQTVLEGIRGAKNISDDIIVYGRSDEDHDRALDETLRKIHSSGLTINKKKCEFKKTKITFYGHVFSADGISPDPNKVKALQEAQEPANKSELRSFLGMAQYSARFIPNFSTLTTPLRSLMKDDTPWKWSEKHAAAFAEVKNALSVDATNAYFSPNKHTTIIVDASPVGLAAFLTQEGRTISYASRSLSATEQKYSQTEREALAIIWACEHFHIYVCGANFTVVTDHQPLVHIWKKVNPPLRIARWALRLQQYSASIQYKPGKDNPADYMSRHPAQTSVKSNQEERIAEEYVNFIANTSTPVVLTLADIKTATAVDATLQTVIQLARSGQWHNVGDYKGQEGVNFDALLRSKVSKMRSPSVIT